MKKLITITGIFALLLISQNAFSQEKNAAINSNTIKKDTKEKTVVYDGSVNYKSEFISFDNAERVVMDENTSTMKIYNPKNLKIISVKTFTKPQKKESDFVTYNYKENTIIL